MATITEPMALDASFNTTETTPRSQADVLAGIEQAILQGMGRQANEVSYDNTTSGLSADDVQEAIDELASEKVDKVTGKGLSTNDYTNDEKTKLAGIEAGAQVNPQIDSVLSDSSTNAIQNKVVKGALDGKADNADVEGTQTVSGNPITLTDASETYAQSLVVELEPKQDLHGQSAPYVGGAGKNKLPMTVDGIKAANTSGSWSGNVYSVYGVTYTVNTDNVGNVISINANGQASDYADLLLITNLTFAQTMILNGCPAGGGNNTFSLRASGIAGETGSGLEIPANSTATYYIRIALGYNAQNVLFKPMIRLSTETDPTFAPYSNICPITGYDECEVESVGKNLFDEDGFISEYSTRYTKASDGSVETVGTLNSGDILWENTEGFTGDLTLSFKYKYANTGSVGVRPYVYYTDGTFTTVYTSNSQSYNTVTKIFASGGKVVYKITVDYGTSSNKTNFYLQIEKNNQATEYEPYHSSNATIQFGQTVMGGKVNVTDGGTDGTKTRIEVSSSWSWSKSSSYPGAFYAQAGATLKTNTPFICTHGKTVTSLSEYVYGTVYCDYSLNFRLMPEGSEIQDWKDFLDAQRANGTPVCICGELNTPIKLSTPPTELKLLKGTNNITTNGTTINLDYIPDNSIGDAVKASEEYTDRAVNVEIEKHLEMPYLRILDNDVDTEIKNYRLYYRMIASAYTLVNLAEMLQHRFLFVEIIQNPSGTSSDKLLHSVLIDPRTIDGFEYQMKAGTGDTVCIKTNIAENKLDLYVQSTGTHTSGDPTDYYVTIRMVD